MAERGFSDLFSSATSVLNSQGHHSSSTSSSSPSPSPSPSSLSASAAGQAPQKPTGHGQKPSYSEVFSSAKVVMSAAKAKVHKDSEGEVIDLGKVAGAAGTLVGAAAHYGKVDETSYGKYAQKVEDYLHNYEAKHQKVNRESSAQHGNQDHGFSEGGQAPANKASGGHYGAQNQQPAGYTGMQPPVGYPAAQNQPPAGTDAHQTSCSSSQNKGNHASAGRPPAGYPGAHSTSYASAPPYEYQDFVEGYPPSDYPSH